MHNLYSVNLMVEGSRSFEGKTSTVMGYFRIHMVFN